MQIDEYLDNHVFFLGLSDDYTLGAKEKLRGYIESIPPHLQPFLLGNAEAGLSPVTTVIEKDFEAGGGAQYSSSERSITIGKWEFDNLDSLPFYHEFGHALDDAMRQNRWDNIGGYEMISDQGAYLEILTSRLYDPNTYEDGIARRYSNSFDLREHPDVAAKENFASMTATYLMLRHHDFSHEDALFRMKEAPTDPIFKPRSPDLVDIHQRLLSRGGDILVAAIDGDDVNISVSEERIGIALDGDTYTKGIFRRSATDGRIDNSSGIDDTELSILSELANATFLPESDNGVKFSSREKAAIREAAELKREAKSYSLQEIQEAGSQPLADLTRLSAQNVPER